MKIVFISCSLLVCELKQQRFLLLLWKLHFNFIEYMIWMWHEDLLCITVVCRIRIKSYRDISIILCLMNNIMSITIFIHHFLKNFIKFIPYMFEFKITPMPPKRVAYFLATIFIFSIQSTFLIFYNVRLSNYCNFDLSY